MTGRELKQLLEQLTNGFCSGYLNRNLLTEASGDSLLETLNVLDEVIPGMTEADVKRALDAADGYSPMELAKAARAMSEAVTDEEYEEKAASLMDMLLTNLNLTGQIELNPSAFYRN